MSKYETTFILEPALDEGRVNEEVERVSQWIKDLGGHVLEVQRWGKKRLSYEINRKRDGIYTWVLYEGPGEVVAEVERRLRLNESVMRVLTVLYVQPEPAEASRPETGETEETEEAAATAGDPAVED